MNTHDDAYLDLLDPRLDDQQRAVCSASGNIVVAAGAGSGKTQVLATRFSWLVMSCGIPVDRILTLTFTDKAASEMYERIYERLSYFSVHPAVPRVQRERAVQALRSFSDAHIQTLDSYCAALVRQAAQRYGIRPDFSIGTVDVERMIYERAFSFVLAHRFEPAIQAIAQPGRLQDVADVFFARTISRYTSLAVPPDFFTGALSRQRQVIADAWQQAVNGDAPADETATIPVSHLVRCIQDEYQRLKEKNITSEYCQRLFAVIPFDADDARRIIPEPIVVTPENIADGSIVGAVTDYLVWLTRACFPQTLPGYTASLRRLVNQELIKKTLPYVRSIAQYIIDYQTIVRLSELLDELCVAVQQLKRTSGLLTFFDVSELALDIVREHEDIRRQERDTYQKIMIDEFQDNNGKNRDLLFLLSQRDDGTIDPEKLFFVGDEKQSIYKFRGADVAVFNELKRTVGVGHVKNMVYNYRSSGALLTAYNQLFGGCDGSDGRAADESYQVFPSQATHEYEASFASDTCAQKFNGETRLPLPPVVLTAETVPIHVCLFNTALLSGDDADELLSADEQVAYFIAQKITALVGTEIDGRMISWRDIAILDRTRTKRTVLTQALNRAGVPYMVDQQSNLFAEALVNDIYHFIRLCMYPSDMRSFAVYLRSPFAALSEQSLETIFALSCESDAAGQVAFNAFSPDSDHRVQAALDANEYERYQQAACRYREMMLFVRSHRLTESLNRLWYEYGYRYEYMWNATAVLFAVQYEVLYEIARRADEAGKGPAWFIDELALKQHGAGRSDDSESAVDDVSFPTEERDAVTVMTVHKSKGLEFPIVFVMGCTGKPHGDSDEPFFFYSPDDGVAMRVGEAHNYFFVRQQQEAEKKNEAEFRRLIYVALTRAEKHVYVVGTWTLGQDGMPKHPYIVETIAAHYYAPVTQAEPDSNRAHFIAGAPFDMTHIAPVKRTVLFTSKTARADSITEKRRMIAAALPLYAAVHVTDTPAVPPSHFSPSSFEAVRDAESASGMDIPYPEIDRAIERSQGAFTHDAFGTLMHAYLENVLQSDAPYDCPLPESLLSRIPRPFVRSIQRACIQMRDAFLASDVGTLFLANKARWFRTEYRFKSVISSTVISGTIDVLFMTADDQAVIIDYKTDGEIVPERYYEQLYCYQHAAALLRSLPRENIRCIVFYLRYGTACDVTAALASLSDDDIAHTIAARE
ncbi:MAG: UvrD-helicase domain-containing protein [Treponema sp.]|nr:UvrD-helicase domain-containing protein [Treponema sp.]